MPCALDGAADMSQPRVSGYCLRLHAEVGTSFDLESGSGPQVAPPEFTSATDCYGSEPRILVAWAPSGEPGSASTACSNHCFAPLISPRLSETSPSLNSGLTQR